MKLILASGSKQRQDLFNMIGLKYEIIKSDEEEISNATDPGEYVKDLSLIKANSVAKRINEKAVIISADSIIYMDGKIYEKPKTKEEAFNNIREMSGKVNYAYTGITVKDLYQDRVITFYDVCKVYIKNVCDEDIKWYIDTDEHLLERCGYSLLGRGAIFLDKVDGDYNTMIGISPSKVHDTLKELGYKISDFNDK